MDRERFREQLLVIMEGKDHWAWPAFTAGLVPKNRLHHHFGKRVGFQLLTLPPLGEACLRRIYHFDGSDRALGRAPSDRQTR